MMIADQDAKAEREDERGGEIVLHGLLGLMRRLDGDIAGAAELAARVSARAVR